MSAPKAKGYNSNPKGIQSHILPHAGALTERTTRYFGIDLARLPQMDDRELALFADRATAMTRLKEILPILEKHFTTLIEGKFDTKNEKSSITANSIKDCQSRCP